MAADATVAFAAAIEGVAAPVEQRCIPPGCRRNRAGGDFQTQASQAAAGIERYPDKKSGPGVRFRTRHRFFSDVYSVDRGRPGRDAEMSRR